MFLENIENGHFMKTKHYLRHENNVTRYEYAWKNIYIQHQKQWKNFFSYIKLTDQLLFKPDFRKVDQHIHKMSPSIDVPNNHKD